MLSDNKFTAIDLFAGIGGFRLAIERNGGECIHFSEINNDAIKTYNSNFPKSCHTNLGDITLLKELPKHDLLTGGVPCQSWSIAGRNLGFDDDRGQLWNDSIYLLNQSRPKAFIFENVKGLVDPRNKSALEYILTRIKEAGYYADIYVLNSFDYGVPQSRVRIYIIGFAKKEYFVRFKLPTYSGAKIKLADILDGYTYNNSSININNIELDLFGKPIVDNRSSSTSLSKNNNGYNDYFLFNDLRNGCTTIHSWDILQTTKKQKNICMILLKNRRKSSYGKLDGNPLSLKHFQELDKNINQEDLDELTQCGILKAEKYSFKLLKASNNKHLSEDEDFVLSMAINDTLIVDDLTCNRQLKVKKLKVKALLNNLEEYGLIQCTELRYDFKQTKISTGLFGVNRIFLPSSNIFPTLVASDSNDFVTTLDIHAENENIYRSKFLAEVYECKNYRKITKQEACRIQGFPDNFILPESRARWMKLIGNSVSVPVIEQLVDAICKTDVFKKNK